MDQSPHILKLLKICFNSLMITVVVVVVMIIIIIIIGMLSEQVLSDCNAFCCIRKASG
jgi:hypothetical protein